MKLQCIDYKQAFLSQNSYTEALQYVAFPEQTALIHSFFYICKKKKIRKSSTNIYLQNIWHMVISKHLGNKSFIKMNTICGYITLNKVVFGRTGVCSNHLYKGIHPLSMENTQAYHSLCSEITTM